MKASVIIQARMDSSRLRGKVLMELAGKAVLEHVISRCQNAQEILKVVVATTTEQDDEPVVQLAKKCQAAVYRGSEQDVLDRYYQAAKIFGLKDIVRITADCPVIDPKLIDQVVSMYFKTEADFCSNTVVSTFPDGEDIEVFSFACLSKAWEKSQLLSEREHVTAYIKKYPKEFKIVSFEGKQKLKDKRWTLDQLEDYHFLNVLFEYFYPQNPLFGIDEVLAFLEKYPESGMINAHIIRDEGYKKSLEKDKNIRL